MNDDLGFAIHATVHAERGLPAKLSDQLCIPYQILINKANYAVETNYFSPNELMALMRATGDYQIVDAFNRFLPQANEGVHLNDALLQIVSEIGDVINCFNTAYEDQKLTQREKGELYREINEAREKLRQFELSIEQH